MRSAPTWKRASLRLGYENNRQVDIVSTLDVDLMTMLVADQVARLKR
jgi:hypothetical protein